MTRILLFAGATIGFLFAVSAMMVGTVVTADAQAGRRGPPWAMPNECYIDDGYGRFSPCG